MNNRSPRFAGSRATLAHRGATALDAVAAAIESIRSGRPVVVVDSPDRENEGDLVLAASNATPELLAFMIRHTSGLVCVAMPGADLDRLGLPAMTAVNEDPKGTAYAVSVDAREGVSTGISARDRALTICMLAQPTSRREDFTRPGHVLPLRARPGGVLERSGHTEAAVDLAELAGLPPAGVICELVSDDGSLMGSDQLRAFADEHGLAMISIADLAEYRWQHDTLVARSAHVRLPILRGEFRAVGYRSLVDANEHLALVCGYVRLGDDVLVRVHRECLIGDVFGSLACTCAADLDTALSAVAAAGRGVVVYVRQDRSVSRELSQLAGQQCSAGSPGRDGRPDRFDDEGCGLAAQMLSDLGVNSVRLLNSDQTTSAALRRYGIAVTAPARELLLPAAVA